MFYYIIICLIVLILLIIRALLKISCHRMPDIYTPEEIKNLSTESYQFGRWRPARPLSGPQGLIFRRIKISWRVFTGKYDVINWGKE